MTSQAAEPLPLPSSRKAGGLKPWPADYGHARPGGGSGGGDDGGVDFKKLFFAFRRRLWLFIAIAALVFAGFILGPLRATPVYTATARVEIDPRKKDVVEVHQVEADQPVNEVLNIVDTEVEVLKSRHLADRVASELHLDQDPEFNPALRKTGLVGTILHGVLQFLPKPEQAPASEVFATQAAHERVIDAVIGRLKVRRSGLTFVIDVSFTSRDQVKAALIANAFADRYLTDQTLSKVEANRDANSSLNARAAQMEQDLKKAEDALAQYKISHNLLSAGNETLTQQELSNLDTQMAQAKAAQAEAEAQARTARAQLAAGSNGSDVTGALVSPVVTSLRAQRATISTHVAELSQKYGPLHPDLLKAKHQLAEIDSEIQQEVNRTISGLDAQARIAKERTDSLQATLNKTRGALESNNRTSVELNALERNADAERALYEAFLTRAKQTGADQGLEVSDAHVLSRAKTPTQPSAPNIPILLLLAFVSAAGLGVAGVIIAEKLESSLITGEDVEKRLDIAFLGAIPHLASVIERAPRRAGRKWSIDPATYVVEKPLSVFGEAFRGLRTSIRYAQLGQGGQVIAFASALPGEGKTTSAVCLGRSAARAGERVVVVDCDLRKNSISKALGMRPTKGLFEILSGEAKLDDALVRDDASGAWILPVSASVTPKLVFGTPAIDRLFADLRRRFDLIVLDTPPVLAVSDARDIVAMADGVIFLARWRHTPQKAIEAALQMIVRVDSRLIGLVHTQVDMRQLSRYGYGDAGYYYRRYRAYYGS